MALTQTRPQTHEPTSVAARGPSGILEVTDHKEVGRLFIGAGALFALAGVIVSVVAALESADLASFSVAKDADEYTQIWSMGRDLLLFGGIVPLLVGLAVYLVPLQIGSPTLVFARGAAAAFWIWLLGSGLLITSYLMNGGPGGGRRDFVILWAASLAMMIGGIVWALLAVATTILGARTQGMTLERVPLTTWSFFVFSLVGLFSLPILMAELLLAYMRLRYGHLGAPDSESLVGVLNGATIAPAAYWVGVPVLGMAADIIATHTGVAPRFHKMLMGTIGFFGILTFFPDLVGFGSVRTLDLDNGLMVVGLLVMSLPVLATLAMVGDSIRLGKLSASAPLLGALVSGLLLLAATAASVLAQVEPIMGFLDRLFPDQIDMTNTLILNGTTFHEGVRALASGAALVAVAAAVNHWGIKIWGRQPAQSAGSAAVLATAGGAALWGVAEIAAGIQDKAMYPSASSDTSGALGLWGVLAMAGTAVMAVGLVALVASIAGAGFGKRAGTGPQGWSGSTLEWATSSPPPLGNFVGPPVVGSAYPLLDGELAYANAPAGPVDQADETETEES